MNQEVSLFIEKLASPWQVQLCGQLRQIVHETIPGAEEKIQYKKPHFLKNGQFAAVISPSKDAIAFMIMNTADMTFPKGFEGPTERKWIKLREGDTPDLVQLSGYLKQASESL